MSLPNTEAVDDARNLDWWDLWPMAEQAQTYDYNMLLLCFRSP